MGRAGWRRSIGASILVVMVWALSGGVAAAAEHVVQPGQGLRFDQVDETFDGYVQADSDWGRATADLPALRAVSGIETGYLNVWIDGVGWSVQNLLVDAASGYPTISVYFDLGVAPGTDVSGLDAYAVLSSGVKTSFSSGPLGAYAVSATEYNAEGYGAAVTGPRALPPPGGVAYDNAIWNLLRALGSPNVEAAENQCGPAAGANSLAWLKDKYKIGVTDQLIPGVDGVPANSIPAQLDADMEREAGETIDPTQMISGMMRYAFRNDLGLTVKYAGSDTPAQVTAAGTGWTVFRDQATVTAGWLEREMLAGEDVEIGFLRPAGGGGHIVKVTSVSTEGGKLKITAAHDGKQGAAGGREFVEYTFENTDADPDLEMVSGDTPGSELKFAVSESPEHHPPVIDPLYPAYGRSVWVYGDLSDSSPKYEGGYAGFDDTSTAAYDNPHGGYDTSTNKCKVCHAVHRAEGAYYLLRADSQDDACDYCHIGGSAHSSLVVYDAVADPTSATNGHTIGASTFIPDSTTAQWTEEVTLATVDATMNPLTETIEVRAYDSDKNDMYRFARHHGHSRADGGARRNYVPVGPLALRCMSCHQVHNAAAMTWQSYDIDLMGTAGQYTTETSAGAMASYKLLRQHPSGTWLEDAVVTTIVSGVPTTTIGVDYYGQVPLGNISIVPEATLTAGVNFDNVRARGADPGALSLVRGATSTAMNRPMWVAQNFDGEHDRNELLAEEAIAASVNNAALSVWCADCHNLNIGGWEHLANEELGFKAHTERTHPAPYTGSHSGPGQCYSCHRADLPIFNAGDSCSQCHYGTGNYKENRTVGMAEYVASDFPHAGDDSYKLLGDYSVNIPAGGLVYGTPATVTGSGNIGSVAMDITADTIDAVCLRCHGGIGTYH